MFWLWLFYFATFPQSTSSSREGVSLNCSTMVEVEAEERVTLNCTIIYHMEHDCAAVYYEWNSTHGKIPCNSSKYSCEWDKLSYVSLTISDVTEEENYTVSILTDCGNAKSPVIKVQVKLSNSTNGKVRVEAAGPTQPTDLHTTLIPCVFFLLLVLGLFLLLFAVRHRC